MTVRPQRFLPAFALALLLTPGLRAQDGVVNTPPPPSDNPQDAQAPDQSDTVIKSRVNVVQVFFNVKDKHSALVPGLVKDDFQILEDGKPQTIKYFSAESDQPLTLGLMIDTSYSMNRMLPEEKVVAGGFLQKVVTPKDLAFVVSFDVSVDLLQDLNVILAVQH